MHALTAVQRDIRSQDPVAANKYIREFTEAFKTYSAALPAEQIEQKILAADIVLVGDYHALPASQNLAAELVEKWSRVRPVVLALEAVLARDQRILDAWWRREIPEEELRRRLRFDREWGYAWDPLYNLLCTARDHADGLYGIDCMPRQDMRRIRSRDRHAAAKICEIREHHPNAAIVVLFGESHMSPQHLPDALRAAKPEERILTVLQNVDAFYWRALDEKASAVSIEEDVICIFNSTPLEKYESYRLCLERWKAAKDEQQDFAPAIYNLIFSLAQSLGFRLDSPRNGTQPKFLADSLPEVVTVEQFPSANGVEAGEERSCLYMPESNSFLIREFQIADAARECARFLHFACRGMTDICAHANPIEDAIARFASRLVSPEISEQTLHSDFGDRLYESYLAGKVPESSLRRIFLAHLQSREQAEAVLAEISKLAKA